MDCRLPGSSIHGILQARILEWVSFPPSGDLPEPGMKPGSPALQADSLLSESLGKLIYIYIYHIYHRYVIFFIHSSVSRYLDCFHVLVNSTTMNIWVHVFF